DPDWLVPEVEGGGQPRDPAADHDHVRRRRRCIVRHDPQPIVTAGGGRRPVTAEGGQCLVTAEGGQCLVTAEGGQCLVTAEGGQCLVTARGGRCRPCPRRRGR